jgi:hypothetical protein
MPLEVLATDLIRLGLTGPEEVDESPKKLAKRLIKEKVVASYREKNGFVYVATKTKWRLLFFRFENKIVHAV